jgi:hypothetical protein
MHQLAKTMPFRGTFCGAPHRSREMDSATAPQGPAAVPPLAPSSEPPIGGHEATHVAPLQGTIHPSAGLPSKSYIPQAFPGVVGSSQCLPPSAGTKGPSPSGKEFSPQALHRIPKGGIKGRRQGGGWVVPPRTEGTIVCRDGDREVIQVPLFAVQFTRSYPT